MENVKKRFSWKIILALGISIIIFLSFHYFIIVGFVNKQTQLREQTLAAEQKIGQQLSNRKIVKLEKEKLEAEIQKQEEEKRRQAEREAEEAEKAEKAESEKIVLAAETEKQMEDLKQASQELADEQKKQEGTQLKIEKCKSEYNASKSKMIVDLEKQLNIMKSLMAEIVDKSYKECVSKLMEESESEYSQVSSTVFSSHISLVGNVCRRSIQENQEKVQLEFDNLKSSKYDKMEQKLQKEYTECLNK